MPRNKQPSGYAKGKHPNSLKNLQLAGGPSRHPAPSGNSHAVTHGGHENPHRERLQAKEREVFDALAADAPVRAVDGSLPRHDSVAVTLLATTLCRLDNVGSYLSDYGWKDAKTKQPRAGVLALEAKLRRIVPRPPRNRIGVLRADRSLGAGRARR